MNHLHLFCQLISNRVMLSNQYKFNILESHPDQELGIVYTHSIDLSQINQESYLESWVMKIAKKFKIDSN